MRVGWVCTYVPEELIHAAGFLPYRLAPGENGQHGNCKMLPPNFCPFVRQLGEDFEKGCLDFLDGIVLASSCNAMIHLYNIIKDRIRTSQFIYLLDVPRKSDDASKTYFKEQLKNLGTFLAKQNGYDIDTSLPGSIALYAKTQSYLEKINYNYHLITNDQWRFFLDLSRQPREKINEQLDLMINNEIASTELEEKPQTTSSFSFETLGLPDDKNNAVVLLTGGIPSPELLTALEDTKVHPILMENCMGLRYLLKDRMFKDWQVLGSLSKESLYSFLAKSYLEKLSCPRTFSQSNFTGNGRQKDLKQLTRLFNIKAVIHHDLNFCDLSNYDYLYLHDFFNASNTPVLRLKTELSKAEIGQIKTRVEAFYEMNLL